MGERNLLTQSYLKSILDYNPDTGIFIWKQPLSYSIEIGDVAGTISGRGYIQIRICKKKHMAHRLAWLYVHGKFPENQIDHINHVKDDNSLTNLRACTQSENFANRKNPISNTSGYKGVHWHKGVKKWRARIKHNRKRFHLGYYICKHKAAVAYNKKALELFGEFACLNKILESPSQKAKDEMEKLNE